MKSIKEKELLVNFARSIGQDVDPAILEEVEQINAIRNSVKTSVQENALGDLFKALKDIPKQEPVLVREEKYYPPPPSLDDLMQLLEEKETTNELVQTSSGQEIPTEESLPDPTSTTPEPPAELTLAEKTAKFISEAPKDSYQQPDPLVVPNDMDAIRGKLKFLEQWVSKISMAGPGSGEVNLRFLDDVDRNAISDDKYLRYESNTRKFTFDSGHKNNFHFAAQSNVNQYISVSNVAYPVTYNAVDFSHGFRLEENSRIVAENPGRYNLQFSIQLENSGAAIETVNVWLSQNGTVVPRTNSKFDVQGKHAGANGAIIASLNYFYETAIANEYVELVWWTPAYNDTYLAYEPALTAINGTRPYVPETPSVIVTVSPIKVDSQ